MEKKIMILCFDGCDFDGVVKKIVSLEDAIKNFNTSNYEWYEILPDSVKMIKSTNTTYNKTYIAEKEVTMPIKVKMELWEEDNFMQMNITDWSHDAAFNTISNKIRKIWNNFIINQDLKDIFRSCWIFQEETSDEYEDTDCITNVWTCDLKEYPRDKKELFQQWTEYFDKNWRA